MRKIIVLSLSVSALLAIGCSIHRVDIQQGNLITPEMVEKLEPGMDQRQVQAILGTPLLRDPFHQDRWDYYYSLKRKNVPLERHALQIYFENGRLARIEGEPHPGDGSAARKRQESP